MGKRRKTGGLFSKRRKLPKVNSTANSIVEFTLGIYSRFFLSENAEKIALALDKSAVL